MYVNKLANAAKKTVINPNMPQVVQDQIKITSNAPITKPKVITPTNVNKVVAPIVKKPEFKPAIVATPPKPPPVIKKQPDVKSPPIDTSSTLTDKKPTLDKYGKLDIAARLKVARDSGASQDVIDGILAERTAKIKDGGDKYKDVMSNEDLLVSLGMKPQGPSDTPFTTPVESAVSADGNGNIDSNWKGPSSEAPTYQDNYKGLSQEDYTKKLTDLARSGVELSANDQISSINRNLADSLSNIEGQRSSIDPAYEDALKSIKQNEFNQSEKSKEQMAQYGWLPSNSGLAIGELGNIATSANKDRALTDRNKALALEDIARQISLAKTRASNDTTDIDRWKAAQLSGADANAMMQSDSRNYGQYRDTVGDWRDNRNFDYGVSRDKRSDEVDNRNYNRGVYESDRGFNRDTYNQDRAFNEGVRQYDQGYNYQIGRDNVLDTRDARNFNEGTRQYDNSFNQSADQFDRNFNQNADQFTRSNSLGWANHNLNQSNSDWAKDPTNPDNIAKAATAASKNSKYSGLGVDDFSKVLDNMYYTDETSNTPVLNTVTGKMEYKENKTGRRVPNSKSITEVQGYLNNLIESGVDPAIVDQLAQKYKIPDWVKPDPKNVPYQTYK